MSIRQTAFPPLPHKHDISDIEGLGNAQPYAEIVFNGTDFNMIENTGAWMGANWSIVKDNVGMAKQPGDPGTGSGYLRVVIPKTQVYEVDFKAVQQTGQNNPFTVTVTKNIRNETKNAVAAAPSTMFSWGVGTANCTRTFNAGDILYFHIWVANTGYIWPVWFGDVRTRIVVRGIQT